MFDDCIKNGGYGEHAVWNLLTSRETVRSVVDVRNDRGFQEKDIDFLVENFNRQFTAIEVKTDFKAHETGNIVYELTTGGNAGCFEKTEADFILYFVPRKKVVYMIDVQRLRAYVHNSHFNEVKMGDDATGFLIPIADLEQAKVIRQVYEGVF